MRALLLLALLFALPTTGRSEPTSCAVQLDRKGLQGAAKGTGHVPWLSALPQPPRRMEPLLAARSLPEGAPLAAQNRSLQASIGPASSHPLGTWQVLHFDDAASLAAALPLLSQRPEILAVEPIRSLSLCADGALQRGAALAEVPWNVARIGAPQALGEIDPDSTLIVAVIDTGADLEHPDLVSRLWRNDDPPGNGSLADDLNDQNGDGLIEDWERDDDDDNGYVDDEFGFDFTDAPGSAGTGDAQDRDPDPSDDNGHGTHVAGIIAAAGGIQGVAPFVRLMPVRAAYNQLFGSGALETDDAAAAIVYAVDNGARILNLSWGDREESLVIRAALDYAVARGVLVVAAAGNQGAQTPHFPSGDARVLGVAASNRQGGPASFSNRGAAAGVEVAAPGEEAPFPGGGILSLVPLELDDDGRRDGYTERRGTSMAAAHVSGALALVLSRAERPDARRARAWLVAAARRPAGEDGSEALGHGEIDVLAAVRTTDDLVVSVLGPSRPYQRGMLTLVGTVLSGDRTWRSLVLGHEASGTSQTVFAEVEGSIVADTLVHMDFRSQLEGEWKATLSVRTAEGRRREWHGAFRVDTSPAHIDTVHVAAAWRGGEPRWLLNLQADESVRARVYENGAAIPLLSDAGAASQIQIETGARASSAAWTLQLENEAGLLTEARLDRPATLPAWPEQNLWVQLDTLSDSFSPTSVWGISPAGPVVWGVDGLSRLVAYAVESDHFQRKHSSSALFGWPRGYADVNDDGAPDLLVQGTGESVLWLLTPGAGAFPDAPSGPVRGRALGLFQLDEDPAFETLVARRDTLLLYDDHVSPRTVLLQVLQNPNRSGFNDWGPGAAVGDFDGDGLLEIACGDAEGFVSRFERSPLGRFELDETIDTGGTYAYELLALPEGSLLVGTQRSTEVTGDGFPSAVYAFTTLGETPASTYPFMARANALRAGSVVASSPATGETWLALVQDQDLYLTRGASEPRQRVSRLADAAGETPVLTDLDGDGNLELVLPTVEGTALYRLREARRGPHALRAESLGPQRLRLSWEPGEALSFHVRRRLDSAWEDLGTTTETTWIDSTLQEFVDATFELDGVLTDGTIIRSNAIVAHAQPLPRWLEARELGETGLRLRASNRIDGASVEARFFSVRAGDGSERHIDRATLAEEGRVVDLILGAPLPCGSFTVETERLRDDQGGVFAGAAASIQGNRDCGQQVFVIVEVTYRAKPRGIQVAWSREPDAAADAVSSYDLRWEGRVLPILEVERLDSTHVLLHFSDSTAWGGRGIPYVLRVVAPIEAREDGAPLEAPELVHRIYVGGQGASGVFPTPNPVRGSSVVFVEAANDTRVQIFDLQGQLVRELQGALGGGLTWDLRTRQGSLVASGVYVYVARDARGTSTGRVAVLR